MADTHGGVRQSGEKRTTEIESDEEEPTPQAVCCVDPANRKLVFKGKAKASVRTWGEFRVLVHQLQQEQATSVFVD
ncbi:hypothetical protein OsI_20537 [Oryza sativa Indica Group]|uniref:Uncharacterized protein n=2 Tax=Oryza sativa TaxID=4530 RepID=B9FL07_ORYSJ|nr:hypothetical protein OsI_20537 [Oryza sativa Indica Group]EEE64285.1 hypothetical protein OsJ_19122 [Oryza sativa Japonica Group]